MAQYIDKDALIEYIEQRYMEHQTGNQPIGCLDRMDEDKVILSFIGTLEVKEVDLEKVIDNQIRLLGGVHTVESSANWYKGPYSELVFFAKYFFELGLNAQQNININITNIDKVMEENGVDPNSKEAKIFKESYYIALEKLKSQKGDV